MNGTGKVNTKKITHSLDITSRRQENGRRALLDFRREELIRDLSHEVRVPCRSEGRSALVRERQIVHVNDPRVSQKSKIEKTWA